MTINGNATEIFKFNMAELWQQKFEETKTALSLDMEVDKKRFAELSKAYADASYNAVMAKTQEQIDEARDIRENYEIALTAFAQRVARDKADTFVDKLGSLLEKAGPIIIKWVIALLV